MHMHHWQRGNLVELDGLLGAVVGVAGDDNVPEDHVAVWFGTPNCVRVSDGGTGRLSPEVWTVPEDTLQPAQPATWKH